MAKTYLGDGLYADHDGMHVVLSAENGVETTQKVFLDDRVLDTFIQWMRENCTVEPLEKICPDCGNEVE